MTTIWIPRMATFALLAFGLGGCVAYQQPAYYAPAPAYYAPAPAYYGPAPGPSVSFEFRGGDRDGHHDHEHWR
jgi:hypothetical protein